ncbi:UbiH/UbiF family hydroxylase [Luteimonas vadosa]|uniref:UbiH/UbiF family hydroxylase n=1 Tax=Luteimonas vadosa TaxID=1165507 RepID=A0ABP9E8B9_9GAMM
MVGGGVVGAACALALSRLGLDVALVEARRPDAWSPGSPDLRVYAFAPDNASLLEDLGVWGHVLEARAQPYRSMRVWDAAGGGELAFDADALGRPELGWIVEHGLLVDVLWQAIARSNVRLLCPAAVEALQQDDAGVELRLDDGTRVAATVAIAADGAQSAVRRLAGIDVSVHDYAQRGLVAYVQTDLPHQATAWQRFLPTGPLAFLPCADGSSSIVWTLPEDEAERVLVLDDQAFGAVLTRAFDARLGEVAPRSRRVAFPLRRQLADTHARGRVLVLGDAAHVVHPLAGQGVNLGLRDVSSLVAWVGKARGSRQDWRSGEKLERWARGRRSEAAVAAHAFDAINRFFSNDALLPTALRGPLLGLAGRLPPLSRGLWRKAAGL